MRPLTFVNGVIFGSAGALGAVLGIVLFFRWVMRIDPSLDQTVVQSDLPLGSLVEDMLIFCALASLAGLGFWGELLRKPWRAAVDILLGLGIAATAVFFFADPDVRATAYARLGVAALALALGFVVLRRFGLLQYLRRWLGE